MTNIYWYEVITALWDDLNHMSGCHRAYGMKLNLSSCVETTNKIHYWKVFEKMFSKKEFDMIYNVNNSIRKFLMHRTNTWNFSLNKICQNSALFCIVKICIDIIAWKIAIFMTWKYTQKRAISIYPTIVLQQIIDLFSQVYNFWNIFFGYCSIKCFLLKPQLLIYLHMGKTYC